MPQWDAALYLKFAGERTQPAIDLIGRINLTAPRRIMDLGCGPGNSTEALRRRWPEATVVGLDRSPEMIAAAKTEYPQGVWEVGDAASWRAGEPFDLVFANALLHWVPDHAKVCPHLLDQVAAGGALAIQAPAHYDSVLYREIVAVSRDPAWNGRMEGARAAVSKICSIVARATGSERKARTDLRVASASLTLITFSGMASSGEWQQMTIGAEVAQARAAAPQTGGHVWNASGPWPSIGYSCVDQPAALNMMECST